MAKTNITICVDTYTLEAYKSKYKGSVSRRLESFMRTDLGMVEQGVLTETDLVKKLKELEEKAQVDAAQRIAVQKKLELLKQQEEEKKQNLQKVNSKERELREKFNHLEAKTTIDLEILGQKLGKSAYDLFKEKYENGEFDF